MSDISGVAVPGVLRLPSSGRDPAGWWSSDEFDEFVTARGAALVRTARALLRDPHHAEDVVQEVLVKAHRHWATIVRQEVPDAYVRRMLVNACTSFRRRGWRREEAVAAGSLPDVVDLRSAAGSGDGFSGDVDDRELMLAMLRRLPAKQRAVLVLRHYEGLPDAIVADVMGTSVQTVRSNVHRGLASLRRMLLDLEGTTR